MAITAVGSGDGRIEIDTRSFGMMLAQVDKVEARMLNALESGLSAAAIVVQNAARKHAPADRRELKNKILFSGKFERSFHSVFTSVIAHAPYSLFVEVGTGIYGPYKRRIYPKRARVLRFTSSRTGSGLVYARSVQGMPARPYLSRAGYETGGEQFNAFRRAFDERMQAGK